MEANMRTGKPRPRLYKVNESFFSAITTDSQAYVLGFISGDGSLSNNTVTIKLNAKDLEHLKKIRNAMQSEHPIKVRDQECYGVPSLVAIISVCSKRICTDLQNLGLHGNKTADLGPWRGPLHLLPAYYRGLIDADGCWSEQIKNGNPKWSICLLGTLPIVEAFSRFCQQNAGKPAQVCKRRNANVFAARLHGLETTKKLAESLYAGAEIWLDRKREIVERMQSYEPKRKDWSALTLEEIEETYRSCGTMEKAAKHFGVNRSYLCRLRSSLINK